MRLTRLLLARSLRPRRDGVIRGHHPQPPLQSALGKYTKDFANLPERYIIRKTTKVLYKSEPDEPASVPELELAPIMHHSMERPWSDEYRNKYNYNPTEREYEYIVEPIAEEDWMWFRGDRVQVMTGKDKGLQGYITQVFQERNWVTVEGCNIKPEIESKDGDFPGVVVQKHMPLLVTTDIKLVDPTDEQPTEVEWRYDEDGNRSRYCVRSGALLDIPLTAGETADYMVRDKYVENKSKDTKAKHVEEITFQPKLATFEMDVMQSMGIKEDRVPRKTWWY